MRKLDIIGQTFNDLKILSENFNQTAKYTRFYNCLCLRCNNDQMMSSLDKVISSAAKQNLADVFVLRDLDAYIVRINQPHSQYLGKNIMMVI